MTVSSVFHFFAHLMERRGYFGQDDKLDNFDFPAHLIATRGGKQSFPDIVLKTNVDEALTGGEFIELKDSDSMRPSSFNSTLPTAVKPFDILSKKMLNQLYELGETPEELPDREVYYLIRGKKKATPSPISKTVLVGGKFFETVSVETLLGGAFDQVANELAKYSDVQPNFVDDIFFEQRAFAASRRVEGASASVRFRVMAEVDPDANLLLESRFPAICDDTLTLLVADDSLPGDDEFANSYEWHSVPGVIEVSPSFTNLESAYNEINPELKLATSVFVLQHPKNGPFFAAQASIH